ncbi:MAG TPA: hypothetical protein VF140_00300 [Phycicoccus sp.]|nr:hypothetical protein [Phycicoccus sp.]
MDLTPERRGAAPASTSRPRGGSDAPQRVRVTSSRRGAARARSRPVSSDLDEQTELGDVYLDGLMREQLRLSLAVLAVTVLGLATLPVLLALVPATRSMSVAGVPLPWLVLGVGIYPAAWVLARWYTRQAERIEADFTEVVETS